MSDRTEFIEVECTCCKKKFNKTLHRYKEAQKMGYSPFCSKKCQGDFRRTSVNMQCSQCNKDIIVLNHDYESSDSKRFFCSKSCSATFNNIKSGPKSQDEKDRIRAGLKRYHDEKGRKPVPPKLIIERKAKEKACLICGKSFRFKSNKHTCCSENCHYIYRFGSLPYTKDEVVNFIVNIAQKTNLTPQQRDCGRRVNGAAIKFFGSWNKAMEACGLKPNTCKYRRIRISCLDGHMADSISERIIDNWFYSNGIRHERSKKYPNSNMNCDFYLLDYDLWVEYFGLSGGDFQEYEETMKTKKELVEINNFNFVALVPKDLYGDDKKSYSEKLHKIFGKYVVSA